jgi:hypothetical protein
LFYYFQLFLSEVGNIAVSLILKGGGGSTINFGFQRGGGRVSTLKCITCTVYLYPIFAKVFNEKRGGGVQSHRTPNPLWICHWLTVLYESLWMCSVHYFVDNYEQFSEKCGTWTKCSGNWKEKGDIWCCITWIQ